MNIAKLINKDTPYSNSLAQEEFDKLIKIDWPATNAARALDLQWEKDFFGNGGEALGALTDIFRTPETGRGVKLALIGPNAYKQMQQWITWWIVNKKYIYRRGKSGKLIRRPSKWYDHCCKLEEHRHPRIMTAEQFKAEYYGTFPIFNDNEHDLRSNI